MKQSLVLGIALLFTLIACSHQEVAVRNPESETGPKKRGITVLFASNRQLEIEPCGCSLTPAGGIDREFNFVQSVKAEVGHPVIGFSAGNTFVPEAKDFQAKSLGFYQRKATYAVRGMNALDLKAVAPSANDFRLGVDNLRQLEKLSTFPWVLANVVDRKTKAPIFKESLSFKVGDDEYLVVGLTHEAEKPFANKQVQVLPPAQVLKDVLAQVKTRKFVIVLSNLSRKEWQEMGDVTSKVQLAMGSIEEDSNAVAWEQWSAGTLFVNPPNRGKFVGRLDLAWVEPIVGFYSPTFVEAAAFHKRSIELAQVEAKMMLGKKLSKKDKKLWTEKAAEADERLAHVTEVPTALAPGLAEATGSIVELSAKYQEPKNVSSEVLTSWQTELRSLAVKK